MSIAACNMADPIRQDSSLSLNCPWQDISVLISPWPATCTYDQNQALWKPQFCSQWPYRVDYITIHPSRLLNFSLDLQETAENSSISALKIMGGKNALALELACILGRNINAQ